MDQHYAVMVRWGYRRDRDGKKEKRFVPYVRHVWKHEAEIHLKKAIAGNYQEVRIATQDECDAEERRDRDEERISKGKGSSRRGGPPAKRFNPPAS